MNAYWFKGAVTAVILLFGPLVLAAPQQRWPERVPRGSAQQAELDRADILGIVPADALIVIEVQDGVLAHKQLQTFASPLPPGMPAAVGLWLSALPLLVRTATGCSIEELVGLVVPRQACFALLPSTRPYPVFFGRIRDEEALRPLLQRLPLAHVIEGGVLCVSDTRQHLDAAMRLQRLGPVGEQKRAGQNRSQQNIAAQPLAKSTAGGQKPLVRAFFNVAGLRRRGLLATLGKQIDPMGRLLFGPWVAALDKTAWIAVSLDVDEGCVRLQATLDGVATGAFAGIWQPATQPRPLPAEPTGTLASVALGRDLGAFFRLAPQLLDAESAAQLKVGLAQIDLFVRGSTLVDGVLPGFEQPPTLFALEAARPADETRPRIELPSIGLVVPMVASRRKQLQAMLENALNVLSTITLAERRRLGREPDLRLRNGHSDGYSYQFLEFGDWQGPGEAPTETALSITLLFAHGYAILATTTDAALRLAKALATGGGQQQVGDALVVHGAALARAVNANLGVLAAGRVFDQGESMAAARRFFQSVASVASILDLRLEVAPERDSTRLQLELRRQR